MSHRRRRPAKADPGPALDALGQALNRTPEQSRARREVVNRHARRNGDRVVFCTPTGAEWRAGDVRSEGKPVYDTERAACAAAAELAALDGVHPMEPYLCHRGPHHHLRSRKLRVL